MHFFFSYNYLYLFSSCDIPLPRSSVTYPVISTDCRNGGRCEFPRRCLEHLHTPKFRGMQEFFPSMLDKEAEPLQPWGRDVLAGTLPVSSGHVQLDAMEVACLLSSSLDQQQGTVQVSQVGGGIGQLCSAFLLQHCNQLPIGNCRVNHISVSLFTP